MKIASSLLLIIAVLFAAALFLRPGSEPQPLEGLPWQVEAQPDGGVRVFNLSLGHDTLGEARDKLGPDMELAVVVKGGETGSLEMYYSRFQAGILSGKLVLTGSLDEATLLKMRKRSGAPRYLDSGARKYHLQPEDLPLAYRAPLQGVTFIPLASIDEDIALKRFGPAAETLRTDTETQHLLYPEIGLDLMINEGHRDVLQYVAPRDFERLRAPLLEQQAQSPATKDPSSAQ
jgi:hypothetical protein